MNNKIDIQRGINRPIEIKGIKAQYILYLAVGLVALLIFFAILYLLGCPVYIILPVVIGLGTALFYYVSKYSKKYGAHGLMKAAGYKKVPKALRSARTLFLKNKNTMIK